MLNGNGGYLGVCGNAADGAIAIALEAFVIRRGPSCIWIIAIAKGQHDYRCPKGEPYETMRYLPPAATKSDLKPGSFGIISV